MTTLRHSEERNWSDRRKQHQPTLDEVVSRLLALRATPRGRVGDKPPPQVERKRPAEGVPRTLPVRAVHRLDRETSGLMVFARTVPAERALVHQFRRHSIHRAYVAIAHGDVQAQTIASQLVRDRGDGRRGSTKLPKAGKRAVTHIRPLESLKDYTVVACRLETGRTHQIRIHLSEHGHFVCGDKVYCQPLFKKPLVDRSGAPRLALHAAELGFVHPITGESLDFTMPLPPDLQQLLNRLRKQAGKPEGGSPQIPREGWPKYVAPAGEESDDDDDDGLPWLAPPEEEPGDRSDATRGRRPTTDRAPGRERGRSERPPSRGEASDGERRFSKKPGPRPETRGTDRRSATPEKRRPEGGRGSQGKPRRPEGKGRPQDQGRPEGRSRRRRRR